MKNLIYSWLFWACYIQILVLISVNFASSICLVEERSLLLQLRRNLDYIHSKSSKLANWNQTLDCCQWNGVQCNSSTGHVVGLDLSSESITNSSDGFSSLFGLQFLQSLSLANNRFRNAEIPSEFGKLVSLTYLNLSNAGFSGQIPTEISYLTKLVTLDLSSISFMGFIPLKLESPSLAVLIRNFTSLRGLYLSGVVISKDGLEWCKALSSAVSNLQILSLSNCNLSGEIHASLGKLRSLSEISLDQNSLAAPVPDFIAEFENLTTLRLRNCQLTGTFPQKILKLPTLRSLELSYNKKLQGSLPEFPSNSSLQTLVVSYTNFSGQLPTSMSSLEQLQKIELVSCSFSGSILPSMKRPDQLVYVNFFANKFSGSIPSFLSAKNLRYLNLSNNRFTNTLESRDWGTLSNLVNLDLSANSLFGGIPMTLFSLPSLQSLKLSQNRFSGEIRELSNMSLILNTLNLSSNSLTGPVPKSLFQLKGLKVLDLSSNNFNGSLNINEIQHLKKLSCLGLSNNNLSVYANETSVNGSSFPQLRKLQLGSCNLQDLPDFLRKQSKLQYLDLSGNNISNTMPQWIWRVGHGSLVSLNLSHNKITGVGRTLPITTALKFLDISHNNIHGEVPTLTSSRVIYLDYSNNNFTSISSDIGNSLQHVIYLSLSKNFISHEIPMTLCNASLLKVLDLSHNYLNGTIPDCIIEMTSTLGVLNLDRNNFRGNIVNVFPEGCKLSVFNIGSNSLQGSLPRSLVNCKQLEVLDVGRNQLHDTFPCWLRDLSNLWVLVLRVNNFYGSVVCSPNNMGWQKLHIFDISFNWFDGELKPQCFSTMKALINSTENPLMAPTQLQYTVLLLGNTFHYQNGLLLTFKGKELYYPKLLSVIKCIDFSSNNFKGDIPISLGNLGEIIALNLSHNAFSGSILPAIGNLHMLESLDLSHNNLNGSIPPQLKNLNFLAVLNLSFNHLAGKIPISTQLQTFDEYSYTGNIGLCGPPLLKNCSNPNPLSLPNDSATTKRKSTSLNWLTIFIGSGFGIGAALVIAPQIIWNKGKNQFNKRVDKFISTILSACGIDHATLDEGCSHSKGVEYQLFDISNFREVKTDEKRAPVRFCVFCSKLDSDRKRVIHDPSCNCHVFPSSNLSSFSLSLSK